MIIAQRRNFIAGAVLSVFACVGNITNVSAQQGQVIELITKLAELLGSAAEAVSKFGDSIAHLVTLGAHGYDAAAARKAHSDLIRLRTGLEQLVAGANIPLIRSINEYVKLQKEHPLEPHAATALWQGIVEKIENATKIVDALLKSVNNIHNDFVLEDAYRTIEIALYGRSSLLAQLHSLAPPRRPAELEALAKAGKEYQNFSDATKKASEQLAAYIKSLR
jgi:hypothetical protein